jgi:glutamyl-Q tRNA(Asp) synthetase
MRPAPRPDLAHLAARLPQRPRTRFAPSPTGFLHLGHVVNAVYVWGLAHALGGSVVLRIEDHDRQRAQPAFERAILEDLAWLGLAPDAPADGRGSPAPCRQSDREPVYTAALARLEAQHLVYACRCSRRQIEAAGSSACGELQYPGTCREAALPWTPGVGLRVRFDEGTERFEDALVGEQLQVPAAQCGDLLVRDRVGQWTYQFAVTVDDVDQDIHLVIRGHDLLASTGRQLQLARRLGRTAPVVFLHHPLVLAPSGTKLSKSNRDAGIRELRAAGHAPADVLGLAAAAVGLTPEPRPVHPDELASLFTR